MRVLTRGLLLPGLAGALAVLGFAPFYAWPVPLLALVVLFRVWDGSGSALQAALSGFAFGLGLFLAGVSWVFVSMHVHGAMHVVLAATATVLFCAYLALFPALAGALAHKWVRDPGWRRCVAMPACFVAAEWLRGWLFTGFPWLNLGTSQVPASPLAGFAPVVGYYGVSLAAALAAGLAAAFLASSPWSRSRYGILAALAALFVSGGLLRTMDWTEPAGAPVKVSLLQGNIPQQLKWREEARAHTFSLYRQMTLEAPGRVVILPETALPAFLDRFPPGYLEGMREHAAEKGRDILFGTMERRFEGERFRYFNSVVRIGAGADQSFRKIHLVPFGEFIPTGFGWVLQILRIPLSDFTSGEPGQAPLSAGGTTFGVANCFEDLFGEEVIEMLPASQVLLNVTNDAWFGQSLAADQHLQASQMRALETGRWMVRATNTGITAAIDPAGRVVAKLPWFQTATLTQEIVPRTGLTPYARIGNAGAFALLALLLALAAWRGRRSVN